MNDWQEFDIPLDSPLEVTAETSIVPVSKPTFAENNGMMLGGYQSNSFKYEMPYVFAGNYTYNTSMRSTYPITSDGGYYPLEMRDSSIVYFGQTVDPTASLSLSVFDTLASFSLSRTEYARALPSGGTVTYHARDNDSDYRIRGTTFRGLVWELILDPYSEAYTEVLIPAQYYSQVSRQPEGYYSINIFPELQSTIRFTYPLWLLATANTLEIGGTLEGGTRASDTSYAFTLTAENDKRVTINGTTATFTPSCYVNPSAPVTITAPNTLQEIVRVMGTRNDTMTFEVSGMVSRTICAAKSIVSPAIQTMPDKPRYPLYPIARIDERSTPANPTIDRYSRTTFSKSYAFVTSLYNPVAPPVQLAMHGIFMRVTALRRKDGNIISPLQVDRATKFCGFLLGSYTGPDDGITDIQCEFRMTQYNVGPLPTNQTYRIPGGAQYTWDVTRYTYHTGSYTTWIGQDASALTGVAGYVFSVPATNISDGDDGRPRFYDEFDVSSYLGGLMRTSSTVAGWYGAYFVFRWRGEWTSGYTTIANMRMYDQTIADESPDTEGILDFFRGASVQIPPLVNSIVTYGLAIRGSIDVGNTHSAIFFNNINIVEWNREQRSKEFTFVFGGAYDENGNPTNRSSTTCFIPFGFEYRYNPPSDMGLRGGDIYPVPYNSLVQYVRAMTGVLGSLNYATGNIYDIQANGTDLELMSVSPRVKENDGFDTIAVFQIYDSDAIAQINTNEDADTSRFIEFKVLGVLKEISHYPYDAQPLICSLSSDIQSLIPAPQVVTSYAGEPHWLFTDTNNIDTQDISIVVQSPLMASATSTLNFNISTRESLAIFKLSGFNSTNIVNNGLTEQALTFVRSQPLPADQTPTQQLSIQGTFQDRTPHAFRFRRMRYIDATGFLQGQIDNVRNYAWSVVSSSYNATMRWFGTTDISFTSSPLSLSSANYAALSWQIDPDKDAEGNEYGLLTISDADIGRYEGRIPGFFSKTNDSMRWVRQTSTASNIHVIFTIDGDPTEHFVDILTVGATYFSIGVIDIRDPLLEEIPIYTSDSFFDSVFIEANHDLKKFNLVNQWYLDTTHVVGKTRDNMLGLYVSTYRQDKEGDDWHKVWEASCSDIAMLKGANWWALASHDNASDTPLGRPKLVSMEWSTGSCIIRQMTIPMTLTYKPDGSIDYTTSFPYQSCSVGISPIIGTQWNFTHDKIWFLLSPNTVITACNFTTSNLLYLGLKNSSVQQCTLKIQSGTSIAGVIDGYGSVGPNGLVTGGCVPSNRCTANGITSTDNEMSWSTPGTSCVIAINKAGGLITIPWATSKIAQSNPAKGDSFVNIGNLDVKLDPTALATALLGGSFNLIFSLTLTIGSATSATAMHSSASWIMSNMSPMTGEGTTAYAAAGAGDPGDLLYMLATANLSGSPPSSGDDDPIPLINQLSSACAILSSDRAISARASCLDSSLSFGYGASSPLYSGPGFMQAQAQYIVRGSGQWSLAYRTSGIKLSLIIPCEIKWSPPVTVLGSGFPIPYPAIAPAGPSYKSAYGNCSKQKDFGAVPPYIDRYTHTTVSYPTAASSTTVSMPVGMMTTDTRSVEVVGGFGGSPQYFSFKVNTENNSLTYPNGCGLVYSSVKPRTSYVATKELGKITMPDVPDVQVPLAGIDQVFGKVLGLLGINAQEDIAGIVKPAAIEGSTADLEYYYADPGNMTYKILPGTLAMYYGSYGGDDIAFVAFRDTRVLDGPPSNVLVNSSYVCLGAPYTSIKASNFRGIAKFIARVEQSDAISLNITGVNSVKGLVAQHSFDGIGNRAYLIQGAATELDGEVVDSLYTISQETTSWVQGDMLPPVAYFVSNNGISVSLFDTYASNVALYSRQLGNIGQAPATRNAYRIALPVAHEVVTYLPHVTRLFSVYNSYVLNGVTSLTTEFREPSMFNTIGAKFEDFTIMGQAYRLGSEWLSRVDATPNGTTVSKVCATLGLTYAGSSTDTAYLFSPTLREFYTFGGNSTVSKFMTANRIIDVTPGIYDFISQDVLFRTTLDVVDTRDKIIRLQKDFAGNVETPNVTIALDDEDWMMYPTSAGVVLAGRQRFQVNRFMLQEYMIPSIIANKAQKLWTPIQGNTLEDYYGMRNYLWEYNPDSQLWGRSMQGNSIKGFYHEVRKLQTSYLGLNDETDCVYEWEITFALNDLLDRIIGDRYVQVNVAEETLCLGGVKQSEVTHIYLTKDLFTRVGKEGIYTFRFTSQNGMGHGSKLFIWSDGMFLLKSLKARLKVMSTKRQYPLQVRQDISGLEQF